MGVVLWLFLPIPIYLAALWDHRRRLGSFKGRIPGKILLAQPVEATDGGPPESTRLLVEYKIGGLQYKGGITLKGIQYQPGGRLLVRYRPESPQDAFVDSQPPFRNWMAMWILWLAPTLGYAFVILAAGLATLFAAIGGGRGYAVEYGRVRRIFMRIALLLIALPFYALGIFAVITNGFWEQNMLWMLWHHVPLR